MCVCVWVCVWERESQINAVIWKPSNWDSVLSIDVMCKSNLFFGTILLSSTSQTLFQFNNWLEWKNYKLILIWDTHFSFDSNLNGPFCAVTDYLQITHKKERERERDLVEHLVKKKSWCRKTSRKGEGEQRQLRKKTLFQRPGGENKGQIPLLKLVSSSFYNSNVRLKIKYNY